MTTNKNYKSYTIVSVFLMIYAALIVSLIVWLFSSNGDKSVTNKLQSPPVIILAIVISVLTFTVSSAVFSAIDKGRSNTALGMPEGSIRALIALSLITLFFILATQIYSKVSEGGIGKLERVSEESLKEISIKDIISKQKIDSLLNKDTTNSGTTSKPKYSYLYDVTVRVAANSDAADMAKNIIASFTALIAAICGFYFGSGASKQSADTLKDIVNPPPPPKKITPKSPIPLTGSINVAMTFEWEVAPPGEQIKVEVTGGTAKPVADITNPLKYTYTPTIAGKVIIKVSLINAPSVFLEHHIEIS